MALRIKRIKSGSFTASTDDVKTDKTLVDQQLGFERVSGNLKINDGGTIKDAIKNITGNAATASRIPWETTLTIGNKYMGFSLPTNLTYTLSEIGAEPKFTKNTAFNKNFGTISGTVCEGSDSRLASAHSHSNKEILDATTASFTNELKTKIDNFNGASSSVKSTTIVIGFTDDCDYVLQSELPAQATINSAINALPSTGGKIILREGTYNIAGSVTMNKDNVTLEGMGNSTILKRQAVFDGGIISMTAHYCKIANCFIDGNYSIYTEDANYGIYVNGGGNNTISSNTCNNNRFGIEVRNSDNNTIIGNAFSFNNYYGIHVSNSDNNTITSNACSSNSNYGIGVFAGNENTISSNTCNSNSYGIEVSAGSENTITGNTCNNNSYGIAVSGGNENTITGNACNNNSYGIEVSGGNENTIIGNACNNNNDCGLYVEGDGSAITGNTCNGNGLCGAGVNGRDNTMAGNACNFNSDYGIHVGGNENTITGNTCNYNGRHGIEVALVENTITGNTCYYNDIGIRILGGDNTISSNTCNNNNSYGIYLSGTNLLVLGNLVSGNAAAIYNGGSDVLLRANKDGISVIED